MKIGLISDLHASNSLPYSQKNAGGVTTDRLEDVIRTIRVAGMSMLKNGVTKMYILGDLFDKKHPDGATLVKTSQVLKELADNGLVVNILPGNHDCVDRDGRLYNLEFYKELRVPNINILDRSVEELENGVRIHHYPWLPEKKVTEQLISADLGVEGDINIAFIHQTVLGAIGDTGWVSDDGISPKILDRYTKVYSGHYHTPQEHSWGMYLGSPLAFRFGDERVLNRGYWICDTENGSNDRMVFMDHPRFATIDIRIGENEKLSDILDVQSWEVLSIDGGKTVIRLEDLQYVRIKLTGDKSSIISSNKDMSEWKETATSSGARMLKYDIEPDTVHVDRLKVDRAVSPARMALEYAKSMDKSEEWARIGQEIIHEVLK